MAALLALLLLAPPGTIRVAVEGPAKEVVALRGGAIRGRARVVDGVALLEGLPRGEYDVHAEGAPLVRGVRTVHDAAPGADVALSSRPTTPVRVETQPGSIVHVGGLAAPADALRLPAGLHAVRVDHPERVPGPVRLLRVGESASLAVELEAGLAVLGTVVDADGEGVPGAFVEAFADGLPTGRFTYADAGGAFGLSGFRGDVVSLRVRAPGRAEALRRVLFRPGEVRARVVVALRPGSGVRLEVRDGSGRPVPGAEAVLLPAWFEETLEEPRLAANYAPPRRRVGVGVRFHGLLPGRRYRILVSAPAFVPGATEEFVAPAPGTVTALPPVVLRRGAVVTGRVDGGRGVVVCEGADGRRTCRTDRAGRFRFDGLDPGRHSLFVEDVDEIPREADLAAGVEQRLEIRVTEPDPGRVLRGSVLDHDGRPLPGVLAAAAGVSAVTDEEGGFLLRGLPPGRAQFEVRFEPGETCRGLLEDPHLPRSERAQIGQPLRVRLDRSATLRLALETGGRPLARARLLLAGTTGGRRQWPLPRGARAAVVPDLPAGSYVADVAAPGLLGTGGSLVRTGEEATLEIARGRSVSGTVVLRRGALAPGAVEATEHDDPVGRGWVRLLDPDPARALAVAPVEPDGTFRLAGLPVAEVLLCYAVPGHPAAVERVDLRGGDAERRVLAVHDAVEAAVRVLDEDGQPLPGARAHVQIEAGVDIRDLAAFGRFRGVAADDEDAREIGPAFRLERDATGRVWSSFVAPGSYFFFLAADGHRSAKFAVRARTAWTIARIRQLPDVPEDLAAPVRLARAKD